MPVTGRHSLLFLLLMGYGCLALPLGLGLHRAGVFVSTLNSDAERLLHQGVQTARSSRALVAVASDMERNAQQFDVLRDPALVAIYHERHRRFMNELASLAGLDSGTEISVKLDQLRQLALSMLQRLIDAQRDGMGIEGELEQFRELLVSARVVQALGARRFETDLNRLGSDARNAREALFTQALVLVPITLFLAAVLSALFSRPVRQLASAIRALGEGALRGPVTIGGPAELAGLGHEIEWLRARLAASDEEKHGFLRRVSHELKTPLAGLREGSGLLADGSVGALDSQQMEVVDIMRECTARLESQIQNLLAFNVMDASRAPKAARPVALHSTISQVLRAHRLEVQRKHIRVEIQLQQASVMFDPELLWMAIDNVIANAIKFTPQDGLVAVTLRLRRERAVLDVVDNGPGIPAEERELVFKPFFQGSAARRGPPGGTGVGLSVVRECLEAHDARVRILDRGSQGAHLQLSFPGGSRDV